MASKQVLFESFRAGLIEFKQSSNTKHFSRSDRDPARYSSKTSSKRRNGGTAKFSSEIIFRSLPINAFNSSLTIKSFITNFSLYRMKISNPSSTISKRRKGISQNHFSTKWWKLRPALSNLVSRRRSPNRRTSNKTSLQTFKWNSIAPSSASYGLKCGLLQTSYGLHVKSLKSLL